MFLCHSGLPSACVFWHFADRRGSSLDGQIIRCIPDVHHHGLPPEQCPRGSGGFCFLGCCLHAYLAALVTVGVYDMMDNGDGKRDLFFSNGYDFGDMKSRG